MKKEPRGWYPFYLLHPAAGVTTPLRYRAASADAAALQYARQRFGRSAAVARKPGYSAEDGSYYYVSLRRRDGAYIPAGKPGCTDADLDTLQAFLEGGLQVWIIQGVSSLKNGYFPRRTGPFNVDQLIERHRGNPRWLEAPIGDPVVVSLWRDVLKTFEPVPQGRKKAPNRGR